MVAVLKLDGDCDNVFHNVLRRIVCRDHAISR